MACVLFFYLHCCYINRWIWNMYAKTLSNPLAIHHSQFPSSKDKLTTLYVIPHAFIIIYNWTSPENLNSKKTASIPLSYSSTRINSCSLDKKILWHVTSNFYSSAYPNISFHLLFQGPRTGCPKMDHFGMKTTLSWRLSRPYRLKGAFCPPIKYLQQSKLGASPRIWIISREGFYLSYLYGRANI